MCLIVFAWKVLPGLPLLAAANRDEFHARPTAPAAWWEDQPDIYAGRDLVAGGTWMGISKNGRFAAVTNIRDPGEMRPEAPSRGHLVSDYLAGTPSPQEYVDAIAPGSAAFNGFNLLVGDAEQLVWFSNKGQDDARNGQPLAPGVYGLCNALLDTPWPKVVKSKAHFGSLLCQCAPKEAYFEMLGDTACASDCRLPDTGVGLERERQLSSVCIRTPDYGTRCSTLALLHADGQATLEERLTPLEG